MKKIVVINGHPDSDSFNEALAQSYIKSSLTNGADIRYVAIGALNFNPISSLVIDKGWTLNQIW